jgi:cyanophycin synthetase
VRLGYGMKQKMLRTAITGNTSGLGMEIAGHKEETKELLEEAHLPIPRGITVYSEEELRERIGEVKFPLVVKPLDGNHGRGVTTDINSLEDAVYGYQRASKVSSGVIVEEFVKGEDYRMLVIDFKLAAVTKRTPASVTGDGFSTISQLVDRENKNPDRGKDDDVLAAIKIDEVTQKILRDKNLSLDSVLPPGKTLALKETANISAGGTATDVTESIHPANKFMAERIARLFNLDICGIDIVASAVDVPLTRDTGAIIEVNAGPGLRMHSNPQKGEARDVAGLVLDMLFPVTASAFIPVVAIAGCAGDNFMARFITHLARHAGYKPGSTSREGLYIMEHCVIHGNSSDYWSGQDLLFDPDIDFAVLVCGWNGILKSGLSFDLCDVSIIADTAESTAQADDVNIRDFGNRMEKLLVDCTKQTGHLILNADDEQVYNLLNRAKSEVALFSTDRNNPNIRQHCRDGGLAAVMDKNAIWICKGEKMISMGEIHHAMLSSENRSDTVIKYTLPSVLTAVICGFHTDTIREGLKSLMKIPIAKEVLSTDP